MKINQWKRELPLWCKGKVCCWKFQTIWVQGTSWIRTLRNNGAYVCMGCHCFMVKYFWPSKSSEVYAKFNYSIHTSSLRTEVQNPDMIQTSKSKLNSVRLCLPLLWPWAIWSRHVLCKQLCYCRIGPLRRLSLVMNHEVLVYNCSWLPACL